MRALCLAAFTLAAFGLSNAVTITNTGAGTQTNRTWTVHRYFAQGELCGYPQPFVGGAATTFWQANVVTRWPADAACAAGYVRTAMISWEATLGIGASMVVDFRATTDGCYLGSAAVCAATALDGQGILDFSAGGAWSLLVSATTGGIAKSADARAMIAAGHYQVLNAGPIFQEVLVREGPQSVAGGTTRTTSFGWQCLTNCGPSSNTYSTSTWGDNASFASIRPSFLLRIYRRWGRIEGDSILSNAWLDRHVDQRMESYSVTTNGGACFTAPAAFNFPARATVWEGPCWNGGDPVDATNTRYDFNVEYMVYSRQIPPFDVTRKPPTDAVALELTTVDSSKQRIGWNNTDQGATTTAGKAPYLGDANWEVNAAAPGGGHWIAVIPRLHARWLLGQYRELWKQMLDSARGYMHFPVTVLSPKTTGNFATGYADVGPFGMPVSLVAHRTYSSVTPSHTTDINDAHRDPATGNKVQSGTGMVVCNYQSSSALGWCSSTPTGGNGVNQFGQDRAHQVNAFYVPWLATGKIFLAEAIQHQATYVAAYSPCVTNMSNPNNDRACELGFTVDNDNTIRSAAWATRQKYLAAVVTPDSPAAVKSYFTAMATAQFAIDEGRLAITDGSYPPPDPLNGDGRWGCPVKSTWLATDHKWCLGRYFYEQGRANSLKIPNWYALQACSGCNQQYTGNGLSPWMVQYATTSYGFARDLGFTGAAKIHEALIRYTVGGVFDSAMGIARGRITYHWPIQNVARTAYLQTWADVANGLVQTQRISRAFSDTATSFRVAGQGLGTAANNYYNSINVHSMNYSVFVVGSERLNMFDVGPSDRSVTIDPATDILTVSHNYQTGDLIRLTRTVSGSAASAQLALPTADAGSLCIVAPNIACDVWVEVLSTNTIKVYKDEARTQLIDFTSNVGSLYACVQTWTVKTLGCGKASCRGMEGTTAASHVAGETITITYGTAGLNQANNYQSEYLPLFYAGLAYAAEYAIDTTDSGGGTITGRRAREMVEQLIPNAYRFGEAGACTDYAQQTCGSPQWNFAPRGAIRARAEGGSGTATLIWTASSGHACRYAVSATAFSTTLDDADTLGAAGPLARSVTVGSLTPGTNYWRITCGPNGGVARASGTVVVQ